MEAGLAPVSSERVANGSWTSPYQIRKGEAGQAAVRSERGEVEAEQAPVRTERGKLAWPLSDQKEGEMAAGLDPVTAWRTKPAQ